MRLALELVGVCDSSSPTLVLSSTEIGHIICSLELWRRGKSLDRLILRIGGILLYVNDSISLDSTLIIFKIIWIVLSSWVRSLQPHTLIDLGHRLWPKGLGFSARVKVLGFGFEETHKNLWRNELLWKGKHLCVWNKGNQCFFFEGKRDNEVNFTWIKWNQCALSNGQVLIN